MSSHTPGNMRPLDIARDLEGLGNLIEIAFSRELSRRGTDIREELNSVKRLIPIIKALGRISDGFRHLVDGFVWEDDERIVGSVMVQRMGNDKTRWYIAAVAVHPSYRRRGIARRLLNAAIEHAHMHGAHTCILDVRVDNAPAYELYRSLGFVHYDSTSEFKLETLPDGPFSRFPPAYTLRPWRIGEWKVSYRLALAETPKQVQGFLPIREEEYLITPLQRVAMPIISRLQGLSTHRFVVERDGNSVAALRLLAQKRERGTHELRMWFIPEYRSALAEPLLAHAMQVLHAFPRRNVIATIRSDFDDLTELLRSFGFVEIEQMHKLGLKLRN